MVAPRLLPRGWSLDVTPIAAQVVPPPPIVTRAEWGADETLGSRRRSFGEIRKVIVHHTVTPGTDPAAEIRGILKYHTQSRGFDDIGYNFVIDRDGVVYEGRWARTYEDGEVHSGEDTSGRGVVGAHASGYNTGSVGIALLGTHTSTGVTDAAMRALAATIAWKVGPRDIDPHGRDAYLKVGDGTTVLFDNIAGHRDVDSTGCPGDGMYVRLAELRDRVSDELDRGLVGLRILGSDGSLWTYGASEQFSTTNDISDPRRSVAHGIPVRAAAGTPTGRGAWVADVNGSVYAFGDAAFFGSMGGRRLNRPIVGMAAHPTGRGYWLVASDGGIFTFGSARFRGSTGAIALNSPIVGMAATPTGRGYWMVARDGGVFTFGDAPFLGSAVGRSELRTPATAIASTPTGRGYWVLDSAGTAFTYGDAPVFGSGVTEGSRPALSIVPIVRP